MAEASGSLTVVGMTFKKKKKINGTNKLHFIKHLSWCVCDVRSFLSMYVSSLILSCSQTDRTLLPCCRSLSMELTRSHCYGFLEITTKALF